MSGSVPGKYVYGQWAFCALVLAGVLAVQSLTPVHLSLYFAQAVIGLAAAVIALLAAKVQNPLLSLFGPARSSLGMWASCGFAGLSVAALMAMPATWRQLTWEGFGQLLSQPPGLVAVAIAPVTEEIYFRGALLGASLGSRWPRLGESRSIGNIYLVAAVFLLFHLPVELEVWRQAWGSGGLPVSLGPLALGLWTGSVVVKDRSLRWAIAAHSLANLSTPVWDVLFRKAFG